MIVAAQQPCFLPWIGYWHKLMTCDIWIEMPHSQMEKGDYFNRVSLPDGWMTLPVNYAHGDTVQETKLAKEAPHAVRKMIKRMQSLYAKAPYKERLSLLFSALEAWTVPGHNLHGFNHMLREVLAQTLEIDIKGKIVQAVPGEGSTTEERLWDMIQKTTPHITTYHSGGAGRSYMKPPYPVPTLFQTITSPHGGHSIVQLIAHAPDPKSVIMSSGHWSDT